MDFLHDRGASLALFSYGFCNFFRPRGGGLRDFFENVALAQHFGPVLRNGKHGRSRNKPAEENIKKFSVRFGGSGKFGGAI
jgi:hypothetical protein